MDILLWHEILEPYELAVKELQVKFRHLIKEHHGKGMYSPIESVSAVSYTHLTLPTICSV